MLYDFCVVRGGILGLATAMQLLQEQPGASVAVYEHFPDLVDHHDAVDTGGDKRAEERLTVRADLKGELMHCRTQDETFLSALRGFVMTPGT